MRAVVLTFDCLPAHLLSCCGHEWMETPVFDRLAARAVLFDRHAVELAGPAGPEHPWWTGRFEFFDTRPRATVPLFDELSARGVACRLLSERSEGLPCSGLALFETVSGEQGLKADHNRVPLASLIRRGIEVLESVSTGEPSLLWLHSRGVPDPWLPPEFFAELYLDELEDLEGDEQGPSGAQIAKTILRQLRRDPALTALLLSEGTGDTDDEEDRAAALAEFGETGRLISKLIFSGYVSLLDHCLKPLMELIERAGPETLFVLTAAGGRAFGERESFLAGLSSSPERGASFDTALSPACLQTPLIILRGGPARLGTRYSELVQPPDVHATLRDWFQCSTTADDAAQPGGFSLQPALRDEPVHDRDVQRHISPQGQLALSDRHWHLLAGDRLEVLTPEDEREHPPQLFALPDDPWLIHDIASQSTAERERLLQILRNALVGRPSQSSEGTSVR